MTTDLWCLLAATLWTLPLVYLPPFGKMKHGGGLAWGSGNRSADPPNLPDWVQRAERAAANHKENLPLFAVVVLVVHVSGNADDVSAGAAVAFVVFRVVHSFLYWFGVKVFAARTVAYYASMAALFVMISRLF